MYWVMLLNVELGNNVEFNNVRFLGEFMWKSQKNKAF